LQSYRLLRHTLLMCDYRSGNWLLGNDRLLWSNDWLRQLSLLLLLYNGRQLLYI
jgi:hypothetical protein